MTEPVLTELGQRYKRNILLISTVGCLLVWVDEVDTNTLTVFGLMVGNNVWFVGIVLFIYQWVLYSLQAFVGWNDWRSNLNTFENSIFYLFGKRKEVGANHNEGTMYRKLAKQNPKKFGHMVYNQKVGSKEKTSEKIDANVSVSTVRSYRIQVVQFVVFDMFLPIGFTIFLIIALSTQPWDKPVTDIETGLKPTAVIINQKMR